MHKSAKWVDEKQALTMKKVSDNGKVNPKRLMTSSSKAHRNQQSKRRDTEECENFDIKDLDEREPCQTFPSHDFQSVSSEQKTLKVPLTTRSTHSLALNNLKKQMTQDLNLTSPAQLEESLQSNPSQQLGNANHRQQTQPTVKYRNEHMKLHAPI